MHPRRGFSGHQSGGADVGPPWMAPHTPGGNGKGGVRPHGSIHKHSSGGIGIFLGGIEGVQGWTGSVRFQLPVERCERASRPVRLLLQRLGH